MNSQNSGTGADNIICTRCGKEWSTTAYEYMFKPNDFEDKPVCERCVKPAIAEHIMELTGKVVNTTDNFKVKMIMNHVHKLIGRL